MTTVWYSWSARTLRTARVWTLVTVKAPSSWARRHTLSAAQQMLLAAIAEGQVQRSTGCGVFEPHYLDGRDVSWRVRVLQLKGLVTIRPVGPAVVSARGAELLADSRPGVRRPLHAVQSLPTSAEEEPIEPDEVAKPRTVVPPVETTKSPRRRLA
jgi:hypothetical protein